MARDLVEIKLRELIRRTADRLSKKAIYRELGAPIPLIVKTAFCEARVIAGETKPAEVEKWLERLVPEVLAPEPERKPEPLPPRELRNS
jgi:hypothetical protein